MSWHAVDAIDDAVEVTRRFLFPFSLVRWTILALLVLLMGGTVNTNISVPFVPEAEFTLFPDGVVPAELASDVDTGMLLGVVALVTVLGVAVSVATLSVRLVFYDALRTNEVRVWGPFVARLRQALGLFVVSTAVGAVVLLPLLVGVVTFTTVGWKPADALGNTVAGLPNWGVGILLVLGGVLTLVALLALRFTYEFVVPVMVHRDVGVVAAWRRFGVTLRRSWTAFLLYLVIHFFIGLAVSIAEAVVFVFAGGVIVVFAGIAVLLLGGVLGGLGAVTSTTAGGVAVALVVGVALLALLFVFAPVRLVTRTYLIAYEVSTLARIDPDLSLLASGVDPTVAPDGRPDNDAELIEDR
ncbi:MAG: hypothetical protein PPP55_06795 [Halorubrum sp.]